MYLYKCVVLCVLDMLHLLLYTCGTLLMKNASIFVLPFLLLVENVIVAPQLK